MITIFNHLPFIFEKLWPLNAAEKKKKIDEVVIKQVSVKDSTRIAS